jgi:Kelch motif
VSKRAAILPMLGLCLGLTHCALSDHYELTSGKLANAGSGADDTAGTGSSDAGGMGAGAAAGASQGGDSLVGGSGAGSAGMPSAGAAGLGIAGASGGHGGAASGCMSACTDLETGCANLATDSSNCGVCGFACDAGRTCSASKCSSGWLGMAGPPAGFVGRSKAATVATGQSVFIWGGLDSNGNALDNGAIYSPATNTWDSVGKGLGMPSARSLATALWTGSVVIVYGGLDGQNNLLKDASAYDPSAKTWSALPSANTRRSQALGFWDGTHAVFWGGSAANSNPIAGADRFDLTTWTTASTGGDPGALTGAATGFDGSVVYVQGGLLNGGARQDRVSSYTTSTDNWSNLAKSLSPRGGAFGVWDGSHFIVWGGRDDNGLRNDGKYMSGATWMPMGAIGAPSARLLFARRSGWAFTVRPGVMAIVGGQVSIAQNGYMGTNGATYDVAANAWKPIATWPSGEQHDYGIGAWTGTEFIVWSGWDNGKLTTTGERLSF